MSGEAGGKIVRGTGGDILVLLDEWIRRIAEEVLREDGEARTPDRGAASDIMDDETRRAIREQVLISNKTYLTRAEAAKYLGVSDRSIAEWAARSADQNPFPVSYAGGDPRYKRSAVDEWAVAEARRQRLKLAG